MNRSFSRRICLSLALTALLLGLSASFAIDATSEEKLADEKAVENTHSANQSLMGFQAGSIYTDTVLVSSFEYTCVNMKIPSWVNSRTKCWGANNYGYTGLGNWSTTTEPYFVQYDSGTGLTKSLGSFGFHTVSLQTNGVINSWGSNQDAELGLGYSNTNTIRGAIGNMPANRTAIHVEAAGAGTSCMIADDQSVWCWGRNQPYGQTGTNTNTTNYSAVFYPTKVLIPNDQPAIALSMGYDFSCVILEDRTGMCWGKNEYAQLGQGDYNESTWSNPTPEPITIIPQNRELSAISLGGGHACAILDNGSIFCWGGNRNGQLGHGTHSIRSTAGDYVQLPVGRTAISISSGVRHTCTILDDHSTYCWGNNTEGQIGDGTFVDISAPGNQNASNPASPVAVSVPAGIEFAAISAGLDHTCAVATNGSLWCWGGHLRGQLGLGKTGTSWDSPIIDSDVPAWVNLSGQSSASAFIPLSDRDPDNDGNLSIFDRTPLGTPVCPPGQYLIVADETCNDASPGHYVPNSNMTYQIPCSSGTYQPNAGQSSCYDADPGHYASIPFLYQTPCDVGQYQNASGQSSCLPTPVGHYNNLTGSTSPIPCSPGYFQSSEGQANCIASQAGYYVPSEGQSAQTICEAGTFQPSTGMTLCWRANLGNHVSQEGATEQSDCQPGTYADVRGLVECKEADPGYIVATNHSATQSACLPGEYQPLSGQESCLMTDIGHYNSDPGSSDMIPCEQGYFEDQMGSTSCSPSEPGYHVPNPGSSGQTECPVGTYSTETATVTCTDASPGYYVPDMGSTMQVECIAGTYTAESGASSCTDADPGYIVRFDGSSQQEECAPGTYQPASGSTDCIAASPGNFVSANAATGQTECMPGTYQWESGQTGCVDSPAGKYSAQAGASTVENCNPGTFQPDTGQSECLDAEAGHFVEGFGATEQLPCEVGTFQSLTGQSDCQQSDPGHTVSSVGSSEQTPCSPGTYQPLFGKESCILASADHFVESAGSSQQTRCPSGESQPEEGQSSCISDEDSELPIIPIAGAAIVVLAIGGFLMTQGKSKPAPKGKRARRPPEGAKRRKKRPKGAGKPKPRKAAPKKIEEE